MNKNDKYAGYNGLSVEYYKKYTHILYKSIQMPHCYWTQSLRRVAGVRLAMEEGACLVANGLPVSIPALYVSGVSLGNRLHLDYLVVVVRGSCGAIAWLPHFCVPGQLWLQELPFNFHFKFLKEKKI